MALYSLVYSKTGQLVEVARHPLDKAGKPLPVRWGSPAAEKTLVIKNEVELTTEQADALGVVSAGRGGDGDRKSAADIALENVATDKVLRDALIDSAIREVLDA